MISLALNCEFGKMRIRPHINLKEKLADLAGSLAIITSAPYGYPDFITYEINKADIIDLWSQIKPALKRDLEQAQTIDSKLANMFDAFESGDAQAGRDTAWALYNMNVKKLR